jgi:uncharacterized metal-binding protein YceD (DUF177 family)
MSDDLNWRVLVTVSDLPPAGTEYELVPDASVRASLARRAGVPAVVKLIARLKVAPAGRGVTVDGLLDAVVRQNCVVSLEPFDNNINETISLRFQPASDVELRVQQVEEIVGEDPPEPLVDGKLDLAEVVAEFLILSVDPYPRRPGVEFSAPAEREDEAKEASPFAALAKLKSGVVGKK